MALPLLLSVNHYRGIINTLIERCPRLEFLSLSEGQRIASELFERGRWPNLKTLYITGDPLPSSFSTKIIQSFFDAHPRLESVDIVDLVGASPIAYGPLRNLKLAKPYEKMNARLRETTVHLEQLSLRDVNTIKTREFFSSLRSLRTLIIHSTPDPVMVGYVKQYLPHLEKLHMKWPSDRQLSYADIKRKDGVSCLLF